MSSPAPHHALVTGASRGIGRAIAQQLAARGCRVAVHYHRHGGAAEATLASLPGTGHLAFAADLGSSTDVVRLWRETLAAFGHLDVLVNNAGLYELHPPLATAPADWLAAWRRTLATNLEGPAQLCHLAANAMATRSPEAPTPIAPRPAPPVPQATSVAPAFGRGRIVNISSRGAFRGEPEAPAYGASKAGLNALSQSLARALAPQSIYVFCLAPGWVETEMAADHLAGPAGPEILAQHPLGRVATADEIARTAVFCALDAPAAMTGAILDLNGASYLRT